MRPAPGAPAAAGPPRRLPPPVAAMTGRADDAVDLYGDILGAGAVVGRWVVVERAGGGGFGDVYRARSAGGGEDDAAVKVLRAALVSSTRALRRFRAEAAAVDRLRHPAIPRLLDTGSLHDGRPYVATEWWPGRPLSALLAAGPLPPARAAAIAAPVAGALSAAHAAGIVHRDVKPANVLVADGEPPRVALVDFGIAKLVDDRPAERTATASRVGTPTAMAPEQIRGEPVDARADVYAFGVLLYEMVAGRPPFVAPTPDEIELMHLNAPPPPPSAFAAVPDGVDAVVLRCLAKNPAHRPGSIAEVMDAFREVATGPSPAPRRPVDCVAVYVSAPPAVGSARDRAGAIASAADRLAAAGLTPVAQFGLSVIAAAPAARVSPAAALAHADAVGAQWPDLAIAVAVGPAYAAGGQPDDGPLFDGTRWPSPAVAGYRAADPDVLSAAPPGLASRWRRSNR
ncbi:MAG: serine/threonine protein kinase [Deltaproteobacteria bacterium]|nr:MAG: serine/threonine protein kinase [Deltaproteobacteria bacterium]